MPISVIGAAGLTDDHVRQIEVFVDEQLLELEAARTSRRDQYIIAPHVKERKSDDGTNICHRYNCAGFVVEAYRSVGVEFIQTAPSLLPPVALSTLTDQYPDQVTFLKKPENRERFGIPGEGPWPVMLAGYVVNALDRSVVDIRKRPYLPVPGDEFFPSRRR